MQANLPNPNQPQRSHPTNLASAARGGHAADTHDGAVQQIDIGQRGWLEALPLFLALLESGTHEGKRQAREQLRQMARVADLGALAVERLDQLGDSVFVEAQLAATGICRAAATNDPRQGELNLCAAQTVDAARPVAQIASAALGHPVPLEICYSAAGFYLGTYVDAEPYSRESVEYWRKREEAAAALASGRWTQKQQP
jgi:hypothetical protein